MIAVNENNQARRPRALLFEDDECVRQVVAHLLQRRGYEVFSFEDPSSCCDKTAEACPCGDNETCADVILSDIKMPNMNGLDFLDWLVDRGCCVQHLGLMSAFWTTSSLTRARDRGYRVFKKPAGIWEIDKWLDECVAMSATSRDLADHFLRRSPA